MNGIPSQPLQTLRYDASVYDQLASTYDESRGTFPAAVSEQITEHIVTVTGAQSHTRFLEPGVGTGIIAMPLVQRGYTYVGVDSSPKMLEVFRGKLHGSWHHLVLVEADATALPFPAASFDAALTVSVLYLIPAWQKALAEIRRVVRRGGVYLYCLERAEANSVAAEIDRAWQSILAERGFHHSWHSSVTTDEVLALLESQGCALERSTAATWTAERSLSSYLDYYGKTLRSLYWQLDNDAFSSAVSELRDWAYGHLDVSGAIVMYTKSFDVYAVWRWTGES